MGWGIRSVGPVCLLAANLFWLPAKEPPVWQWGSEGEDACAYTEPKGLLGCRWMNYNNGWGALNAVFEGWKQPYPSDGLCFQGSIASLMLYYQWPDRTRITGWVGRTIKHINHAWRYSDITRFPSCEWDDPMARRLGQCDVEQYCTAGDEIARLYLAVRAAVNYPGDDYGTIWEPQQRLLATMRTRLGFVNAKMISADDPEARSIVIDKLEGRAAPPQPVATFYNGHFWLLDGYAAGGNAANPIDSFHVLTYDNNCNHHTAHWEEGFSELAGDVYLYDLDPTVVLEPGKPFKTEFFFGDRYLPGTDTTQREGRFRLRSLEGAHTIGVNAFYEERVSTHWVVHAELLDVQLTVDTAGAETPFFRFQVPALRDSRIRFSMRLEGADAPASVRLVLDDEEILDEVRLAQSRADSEMYHEQDYHGNSVVLYKPDDSVDEVSIGQKLDLEWEADTDIVTDITASLSLDLGKTWLLLSQTGSLPAEKGFLQWIVPTEMDGPKGKIPMADHYALFRISGYGNPEAYAVSRPVRVVAHAGEKTISVATVPTNATITIPRGESRSLDGRKWADPRHFSAKARPCTQKLYRKRGKS